MTEDAFAPIWAEIDRRGLPVLVHPGEQPGVDLMDKGLYDLSWSVGFMLDTTLAFTRMIFDGFLDRYPDLKLIAAHGGGTPPCLVGRFERGDEVELPERRRTQATPTEYLRRIWYDCITGSLETRRCRLNGLRGLGVDGERDDADPRGRGRPIQVTFLT